MKTNTTKGLRFETIKEIEIDLETRFKQYALARPEELFSRSGAGFNLQAGAFVARIQAAIKRENAPLIEQYVHQNIRQKLKSLIKEAVVFDNSYLPPSLVDMASGKKGRAYVAVDKIEAELQASLNTEGVDNE